MSHEPRDKPSGGYYLDAADMDLGLRVCMDCRGVMDAKVPHTHASKREPARQYVPGHYGAILMGIRWAENQAAGKIGWDTLGR